jgi:hypothetical protein
MVQKFVLIRLTLLLVTLSLASAFMLPKPSVFATKASPLFVGTPLQESTSTTIATNLLRPNDSSRRVAMKVLGIFTFLLPNVAMATTEVELADLPPPWIPVAFGLGLVVVRSWMLSQWFFVARWEFSLERIMLLCCIVGRWFVDG